MTHFNQISISCPVHNLYLEYCCPDNPCYCRRLLCDKCMQYHLLIKPKVQLISFKKLKEDVFYGISSSPKLDFEEQVKIVEKENKRMFQKLDELTSQEKLYSPLFSMINEQGKIIDYFKDLSNSGLTYFYLHCLSKEGVETMKKRIIQLQDGMKPKDEKIQECLKYLEWKKSNCMLARIQKIFDKHSKGKRQMQ